MGIFGFILFGNFLGYLSVFFLKFGHHSAIVFSNKLSASFSLSPFCDLYNVNRVDH